jgi:Fur family ferric uptake transcriptional regulator
VAWYERAWKDEHHDHLICTKCGKVVEFEYPAIDVLQEAVAGEHGFLLTDHHLELMGVCRECQARDADQQQPEPRESRRRRK